MTRESAPVFGDEMRPLLRESRMGFAMQPAQLSWPVELPKIGLPNLGLGEHFVCFCFLRQKEQNTELT